MKNLTLDNLELLEKHLEGKLSEAENLLWEKKLREQPDLRDEVRVYQNLIKGIEAVGTENTLQNIAIWEKEARQPTLTATPTKVVSLHSRRNWLRYVAAAAAVLLLLFPLGRLLFTPSNDNTVALFSDNFEPYKNILSFRGETDEDAFSEGMARYGEGQYDEAITAFQKYLQSDAAVKNQDFAEFFLTQAQLAKGDAAAALPMLERLSKRENFLLIEQVEWCLALAYLKNEDKSSAQKVLQTIANTQNHNYQKKSKQLLQKTKH